MAAAGNSSRAGVNLATGTVTAPANGSVGSVVGEASGSLTIELGDGTYGVRLAPRDDTVQLFSLDEVLSLLPVVTMTINNDDPNYPNEPPSEYLIDVQKGTVTKSPNTPVPSFTRLDSSVYANKNMLLDELRYELGASLRWKMDQGLIRAFQDEVMLGGSVTVEMPVSFGATFAGGVTNGGSGQVQIDRLLADSWVGQMDEYNGLKTTMTPTTANNVTLSSFLPTGTPGQSYARQVLLGDAVWGQLGPQLTMLLNSEVSAQGIWLRTAGQVRQGINEGFAWMDRQVTMRQADLPYNNSLSFHPLPASAEADIWAKLKRLTTAKVAQWRTGMQLTGEVKLFYQSGQLTRLTPTHVVIGGSNGGSGNNTDPSDDKGVNTTGGGLFGFINRIISSIINSFLGIFNGLFGVLR
jgi:hypothetical protein